MTTSVPLACDLLFLISVRFRVHQLPSNWALWFCGFASVVICLWVGEKTLDQINVQRIVGRLNADLQRIVGRLNADLQMEVSNFRYLH
jgi:hypothetical protein